MCETVFKFISPVTCVTRPARVTRPNMRSLTEQVHDVTLGPVRMLCIKYGMLVEFAWISHVRVQRFAASQAERHRPQ